MSLLFSAALPFIIMTVSLGKVIISKQKHYLVILIMPVIFWLILLVFSPVILLRYVLPLVGVEGLLMLPVVNGFYNSRKL